MLEIIINKSFALQLPENFSVPFIDENPLFLDDRIPVPHTTNFAVQKTPQNMQLFKQPDRPTTSGMFDRYPAEIVHFGSVIMKGEIVILNAKEKINLQFINAVMPEQAKKKMNALDFGGLDHGLAPKGELWPDLTPGYYDNPVFDDYKLEISNSVLATPSTRDFITAPVRLIDIAWEGHAGSWGLKNALRMYFNYYNAIDATWTMPEILEYPWARAECHFPIVPFPYLHFVIEKVFGKLLANNPFFDDPNLRRLVMVCFNHKYLNIDNYYFDTFRGDNEGNGNFYIGSVSPLMDDYSVIDENNNMSNSVEFKSFMQEYPFNDFFKELLKLFGMSCYIGETISIEYDNDLLATTQSFDLTPYLIKEPIVSGEKRKHYLLTYGEAKTEETLVNPEWTGLTVAHIFQHIILGDPVTKCYRLQNNPNLILELTKKAVGIPPTGQDQAFIVESKIKTPALSVQQITDEDIETHEVKVDVKPLETNIEHVWNQMVNWDEEYIAKEHWYVPIITKADLKAPPHIMLDAGLQPLISNPDMYYRQLVNHHKDRTPQPDFSLSLLINPTDPDGVFLKYHKPKADWYAKDKIRLIAEGSLTPIQINSISNKHKIHVQGKNFLIIKREYELSNAKQFPVTFTLIEDKRQ